MKWTTQHPVMTIALIASLSAVTSLAVGCGEDSGSSTTTPEATEATTDASTAVPDAVSAGGDELTYRQQQIVGVVDHYLPAWQTTEPAGPGWFFAPRVSSCGRMARRPPPTRCGSPATGVGSRWSLQC